jgi:gas vesicle protein
MVWGYSDLELTHLQERRTTMDERNGSSGAILAGILVGGLVGAGVALLTTPRSGEETRAIIRERSVELKERGANAVEQTRTRANEMVDRSRAAITDRANSLKGAFQDFREDLLTSIEEPEMLEKRQKKAAA